MATRCSLLDTVEGLEAERLHPFDELSLGATIDDETHIQHRPGDSTGGQTHAAYERVAARARRRTRRLP